MLVQQSSYAQKMLVELNVNGYQNLLENFEVSCEKYADRVAFSCLGESITFSQLDRYSKRFASYLRTQASLRPGDRIALQMPNILQYTVAAWGVLRAGLILVNTNPLYTEREIVHQFSDADVSAVLVLEGLLPNIKNVISQTNIKHVVVAKLGPLEAEHQLGEAIEGVQLVAFSEALALGESQTMAKTSITMDDVALLQYTGGTTGVSKGAMLTHGNLFASACQTSSAFEENHELQDIVIAPMPLYHIYGFTWNVISCCLMGSHSVLIPNPRDIHGLVQTMKAYKFSGFAGVNTLFAGLMQHPEFDQIDFSALQGSIAGGSALVRVVAEEWERRTGTRLYEGYALSETASSLSCNTPDAHQMGTVGKHLPAMEVKVVDESGQDVGINQPGELAVRGPQVLVGYWNRPEATREAIDPEGWFKTGDVAVIQPDGFIRIVDRLKDMILVSGFNVYPNEIEDVISGHPAVFECAAVGVKDERTGEAVKVFLVLSDKSATEAELRDFCRERLTAYKVPKYFSFVVELPKSAVGKVLRRELRDK